MHEAVSTDPKTWLSQVVEAHLQLKKQKPLVHCMTNTVAANYVANVLLAVGASPAMIDNPFEAADFTQIANSLSLNLGTPTQEQVEAMQIAANVAHQLNKPWVIDPVGYGPFLKWRSQITDNLLQFKPSIIRGNAAEISGLAGNFHNSKGVDSLVNSNDIYHQASSLLQHTECVAISGEMDIVLSKEHQLVFKIYGGSVLQPQITATGCALGALIAAYAAVSTPTIACLAAHLIFAIAGKNAAEKSLHVGSFNVAFLDLLHEIDQNILFESAHFDIQPL